MITPNNYGEALKKEFYKKGFEISSENLSEAFSLSSKEILESFEYLFILAKKNKSEELSNLLFKENPTLFNKLSTTYNLFS